MRYGGRDSGRMVRSVCEGESRRGKNEGHITKVDTDKFLHQGAFLRLSLPQLCTLPVLPSNTL